MNTALDSLPFAHVFGPFFAPVLAILIAWTIIIKGFALWRAARNSHKIWFIVLLAANTFGILEIIYLLAFSKEKTSVAPAPAPAPGSPSV
jgi:hypothetical protein